MSFRISKLEHKILLLFDLNCVLGYRQNSKIFTSEMKNLSRNTPHICEKGMSTIYRPNFENLMHTIFSKKKSFIEVGVWANQSKEETEVQIQQYFRSLKFNLKVVLFSKNTNNEYVNDYKSIVSNPKDYSELIPHPINRDLNIVFNKHTQYTPQNTLMISNFSNLNKNFTDNDIVLPLYHPKGITNNSTDFYLYMLHEYLSVIIGHYESDKGKFNRDIYLNL